MRTIATDRYYIASDSGLQQAAELWYQSDVLGIDTEFIRTDTFHPIPALIQVSDGQQCWLVDVLSINDFSPLTRVIIAPHITKVFHAAGEDLEVFDRLLGHLPQPLFDTQTGAAFCGYGASIGYSRLVQAVLNVELSKDQCRSDWLARPLSDEQQLYASLDVLYLPTLYNHLQERLQQHQRTAWAHEENLRQITRYCDQREASYNIERINNAWRLDEVEKNRLWHLVLGRDALARKHNKPRNHIAKDFALLEIARRPPSHVAELSGIEGIRSSSIRQFGQHLIKLAQEIPSGIVCPPLPEPLGRQETEHMKQLRAVAEHISAALDLPAELLVKKSELEELVRQYFSAEKPTAIQMPERFNGWRNPVIGNPLQEKITGWG